MLRIPVLRTTDHGPRTTSLRGALPFGASWRTLYFAVGATLAVVIALLALFTRAFE